MNKAYSRINWENEPNISTPLNASNLNRMDSGLNEVDNRVVTFDTTKANQSDLLLDIKTVTYDPTTGIFVFTHQDGSTDTFDLNIEKIPVSFSMDANGVITMETDDGTRYTADVGALIKLYTFNDSDIIDFTTTTDQSGNKTITATIKDGSITGTKLQPNYLADCLAAKSGAETAESKAATSSQDAEAWAVGTRGGVPVPSTDPAYENNAEYWAQHTSSSFAGLTDTNITNPQDGQVPVYNSATNKWENADPSAGGGSKIIVTTSESSLVGENVTLTDGTTTLTATFNNSGVATFEGVTMTGNLTLTATDGSQTATRTLTIPYFGNYSVSMAFFSATITVTFPAGATCTISDGTTTLMATSNPMAFNVSNTGTWTAAATIDGITKSGTPITITTDGQTASDTIEFGTINLTFVNEFQGAPITCSKDGVTITKTAPSSGNTMVFYPPTTGTWIISGTYSGQTYQTSATVTSLSTAVSATLQTVPDGSTVTPTDDIQTWLNCAGIFDKNYTTLSEVLADSTTLLALMSDNNAVDYLVRSKSWASNPNLVPTMTSDTTPSGLVFYTTKDQGTPYQAFTDLNTASGDGYYPSRYNSAGMEVHIGYKFTEAKVVRKLYFTYGVAQSSGTGATVYLQGSNDSTNGDDGTWTDLSPAITMVANNSYAGATEVSLNVNNNGTAYQWYRLSNKAGDQWTYAAGVLHTIKLFEKDTVLTDNSTAMTDIGANNYCANTLLADSDWCTAICNSAYFESVLNVKVPTMSGYTTPSGEVFPNAGSSGYTALWQVFDNDVSTRVEYSTATYPRIGYKFPSAVKCIVAKIGGYSWQNNDYKIPRYQIQGSNDNSNWTDLSDVITNDATASGELKTIILSNVANYLYYALYAPNGGSSRQIESINFYARADV